MLEDESIQDYHLNILDISNSFESLGEKISDEKIVRKILRSLPKRFDMKVTAIEEAQEVSSLKVNELIGSLQNFEITVNIKTDKKGKNIAFTSSRDSDVTQGNHEDDEDMSESLTVLGRQFKKFYKRFKRRSRPNGQYIRPNIDNQPDKEKMARSDEKNSQYKGVQCHECEGYGHIRTKCATFLKKQKKSLIASWSDDDVSEEDGEKDSTKQIAALTSRVLSNAETCDEDLTYGELSDTCKQLEEQINITNKLKDERVRHQAKIPKLNNKVTLLNSQFSHVIKQVKRESTDNSSLSKHLLTHPEKEDVLTRDVKNEENYCLWALQRKRQPVNLMSSTMLEHHEMFEELVPPQCDSIHDMRSVSKSSFSKKINVASRTYEKQLGDSFVRVKKTKQLGKLEGRSGILLKKKLERLSYMERVCF